MLEEVMHSSRAALYSPLQLWGTVRRELISSPLKNCTIIHCLGTLTDVVFHFLMSNRSSNAVFTIEVKVFS